MATLKDLLVSGPARVIGKINATSFVKNGATADNILLAGGGDVAQSAFASGSHTHTTTIATSTGTSQITLAYETKYSITAGGTSYIFTTPSLGTSATTAAAGNHTHTTSLTSGGTSEISLAANTAYTLTAGGTSVVFKTPADNNNVTTGKSSVVLGTTGVAVVQKDGTDSGTVALPSAPPSSWLGTTATTAAAGNHTHSGYLTSYRDYVIYSSTAAGTQTKTGTSNTSFTPVSGGTYLVHITTANTYNGAIKFQGNSVPSTAQTIYINGTVSSSSNKTLPAGLYEAYYNGTTWYFRTDGKRQSGGFVVPGSTGFLKADGSVDNTAYTTNTGTVTSVGLTNATNGGLTVSGSPVTGSGSITVGHTNVLSSAQTTQAVYPITIDKNGHIASYGTAVTIPAVPTDIVNTITTAAGTHTPLTASATGNVSFNVPTNTSHLTNDSGFITSYVDEKVKQTSIPSTSAMYPILTSSETSLTSGTAYEAKYSTKVKIDQSGNLILHNSSTGSNINSPAIHFVRGTVSDTYVDWGIQNVIGVFKSYSRSGSTWTERIALNSSGNLTLNGLTAPSSGTGIVTASKFVKSGATSTNLLQAGGGDIAIGDIVSGTNDGTYWTSLTINGVEKNIPSASYLNDLVDVYTDSQRINEVLAFNGSIWEGMYVAKTVNAGSGLNTTSGDTTNDGGYIGWGTIGGGDASVPTGTLHLTRVNTDSSYDGSAKPGFGPTTDTTVSSSSNTFTVPYYKVDKFGRVTESANKTITISGLGTGGGGGDTVTGKSNVTLSTTATAVLQVNGSDSGSVALPSEPPSTWLGTSGTTAATGSHGHGTITNGGYIRGNSSQAGGVSNNQVAIANGDRIVIADYSGRTSTDYYPLKMTSIVFDGSTTTQFLSKKGTWETPSGGGNISAMSPESLITGYKAGGVVIGQERTEFIVPPARIVESGAASEYNLQRQGVVRPQYEIDATLWEDTLALESGTRLNIFDMIIVPTIPTNTGMNACCFLPITVMYRYNTVTSRYESVPGILISTDPSKPFEMYDIQTQFMFKTK